MEKRRYQIFPNDDRTCVVADFTISAHVMVGAEQDIVVLDANLQTIAVIQLQPGFDRRELQVV